MNALEQMVNDVVKDTEESFKSYAEELGLDYEALRNPDYNREATVDKLVAASIISNDEYEQVKAFFESDLYKRYEEASQNIANSLVSELVGDEPPQTVH
tara:strand:- start:14209 stop:14505 length:297 start_codon:yes stop_codon:yes gene_type:complete